MEPSKEAIEDAAAQILIEIAFLVPIGNMTKHLISAKLNTYKQAIEQRAQAALQKQLAEKDAEIERLKDEILEWKDCAQRNMQSQERDDSNVESELAIEDAGLQEWRKGKTVTS